MLKFITHRSIWLNILVGVLLATGIFSLFILSLNWITHHGRSKTVPSMVGKDYEEARKELRQLGFDVEIQDSIYIDKLPALSVIKQIPDADETVKENRTVYLTINRAVPPMVEMPNLVGYSYRNAEMVLKNMNLRIGDTTFKHDFAKNSVLEQWYNGAVAAPGTKLRMGSTISLVLGDGVGNDEFAVPVIVGMRFSVAKNMLEQSGLGIGSIMIEGITDTLNAFIYKQDPERFDEDKKLQHIRSGQLMSVWLQKDKPVIDTSQIPLQQ